jgi:hypothetical protein
MGHGHKSTGQGDGEQWDVERGHDYRVLDNNFIFTITGKHSRTRWNGQNVNIIIPVCR